MGPFSDTWDRGDAYEQYVGRWSRLVAPRFVSWLRIPAGRRWLDVGCGTGALSAAILDVASPSTVIGVDPSEGFLETARSRLGSTAEFRRGTATEIPLADASVDVAVSGLALNFVSDPSAAILDMSRVADRGGTIAVYVWDYAGKMEMIRLFWDAAVELDPRAAAFDEGARFPMCRPEALQALLADASLQSIETTAIDVATEFAEFDDYWQPFLGGQGPAPAYVATLDADRKERLRDRLRRMLPTAPDGSISLTARAWAARGTVVQYGA